jgi:hypothetical protein
MDGDEEGITSAERGGLRLVVGAGEGETDSVGAIRMNGHAGAGTVSGGQHVGRGEVRRGWLMPAAVAAVLAGTVTGWVTWGVMDHQAGFLRAMVAQKTDLHATAEGDRARLEAQLAVAEKRSAERDASIAALQKQLADGREKLAATEKRLAELETFAGDRQAELARLKTEKEILDTTLVALRRDVEMLYSGQLVTLELKGQPGVSPEARARLLVDLKLKVWRLYADELPRLEGGRVYEFWLITADGAKVPMGSFTPDAQGRGTLSDKVPDPLPALAAAAVSDEPGPGARQPTGKLHVVGEFPKAQ